MYELTDEQMGNVDESWKKLREFQQSLRAKIMEKTYYEILGVSEDASQEEIRAAYIKLARQHDADEAALKELNVAYGTLSEPDKRAGYDAGLCYKRTGEWPEGYGYGLRN